MPATQVVPWLRRCNAEAESERWRVRESDFLELMRTIRAQGFATTAGDVTPGMGAIALTFTSPMSRTPLAVGVGGPIAQMEAEREAIVEALHAFAAGDDEASASKGQDAADNEPQAAA
jgi:DNA-binding IclR family transcriptional regulator